MAVAGQEKVIISSDTLSPELHGWLEGEAEELSVCMAARERRKRCFGLEAERDT